MHCQHITYGVLGEACVGYSIYTDNTELTLLCIVLLPIEMYM